MDRYTTFIAGSIFDLKNQLNDNAASGYALCLMEIQVEQYSTGGTSMPQYVVIMEYQHVQPTAFPPFNVKSKEQSKEQPKEQAKKEDNR